jgi:hypothetical protein
MKYLYEPQAEAPNAAIQAIQVCQVNKKSKGEQADR